MMGDAVMTVGDARTGKPARPVTSHGNYPIRCTYMSGNRACVRLQLSRLGHLISNIEYEGVPFMLFKH